MLKAAQKSSSVSIARILRVESCTKSSSVSIARILRVSLCTLSGVRGNSHTQTTHNKQVVRISELPACTPSRECDHAHELVHQRPGKRERFKGALQLGSTGILWRNKMKIRVSKDTFLEGCLNGIQQLYTQFCRKDFMICDRQYHFHF